MALMALRFVEVKVQNLLKEFVLSIWEGALAATGNTVTFLEPAAPPKVAEVMLIVAGE